MADLEELKRLMLPTGFGTQPSRGGARRKAESRVAPSSARQPATLPTAVSVPATTTPKEEQEIHGTAARDEQTIMGDQDREQVDDEQDDEDQVPPISHEVQLKGHSKVVTSVDVDPSGSRVITGSYDCTVKFWDFNGMDAGLRSFRTLEPQDGLQVVDLQWSHTGDQFLMATNASQARLYDRDGAMISEFAKGDMYIRDLRNTDGHVGSLTAVRWQPHQKQYFATASADSTVRVWDVAKTRRQQSVIVFKHGTGAKGSQARTAVTSLSYSQDGNLLAAGAADGSIRMWSSSGPFINAALEHASAHMSGSSLTSLEFGTDTHSLLTRGTDDVVKLWDMRKFKSPVAMRNDVWTLFEQSNAIFSPTGGYVVAGTSCRKGDETGHLLLLSTRDMAVVDKIAIPGSVVRVKWHAKINQILATTSGGSTHVLYDPVSSTRGARLCVSKPERTKQVDDMSDLLAERAVAAMSATSTGYTRDSDLLNPTGKLTKRKVEKLRKDPRATRAPGLPHKGPGAGGKIGESELQAQLRGMNNDRSRDEDPREAFLKHARAAQEDPYWIAPAYKGTQPRNILAKQVLEEQEMQNLIQDEDKQRGGGKRRRI
ncbi:hypothetical protein RI367_005940 [Sorochytrium milnesiophthora]